MIKEAERSSWTRWSTKEKWKILMRRKSRLQNCTGRLFSPKIMCSRFYFFSLTGRQAVVYVRYRLGRIIQRSECFLVYRFQELKWKNWSDGQLTRDRCTRAFPLKSSTWNEFAVRPPRQSHVRSSRYSSLLNQHRDDDNPFDRWFMIDLGEGRQKANSVIRIYLNEF